MTTAVKIYRDRDGWRYDSEDMSVKSAAFPSYPEAVKQATAGGYEISNAGWRHRLLVWNWHAHSLDGYPGWETSEGHPAFVKLAHKRGGSDADVESHKIAARWDDVATVDFYQRDWTEDGIPFVLEGGTYWSGWWFATVAERDRFLEWYKETYPSALES